MFYIFFNIFNFYILNFNILKYVHIYFWVFFADNNF